MKIKPIAPLPEWIRTLAAASKHQDRPENAEIPLTEYDLPHNVAQATQFLLHADIAVEGEAGDSLTLKTACWIRDYAISQPMCLELMSEHWNERCEPPWSMDELSIKISNAYRYAQNRPGERTPEFIFKDHMRSNTILSDSEDLSWKYPTLAEIVARGAKEPEWLIEDYFPVHSINMLYGDSGTHKSTIGLDLAMCIATGTPWHGKEVKRGTVIFILAEGRFFFHFRIKAWLKAHPEITTPLENIPIVITDVPVHFDNKACIDRLVANADYWPKHHSLPLCGVFIDTLNLSIGYSRNESDTADAGAFMGQLGTLLRDRYGCGTWAIHHVGKKDIKVMRGAKVFRDASDTNYLIECKEEGDSSPIMTCTKMRDFARPARLRFKAEKIKLGITRKGKDVVAFVLHPSLSGNSDPSIFEGSILGGTKKELLELLKKPRSNNMTAIHSVWSMPGFTDKARLKVMLTELMAERLIVLSKGNYRRV